MHETYDDIRSRIQELPKWFDEYAVPRYCEFHPEHCADIYARQACLLRIECQGCGREFRVAMSWSGYDEIEALDWLVEQKTIHYGDPPNVECCASGPTMNSVPRRVLQFWRRTRPEWERVSGLEIEIDPDWARD